MTDSGGIVSSYALSIAMAMATIGALVIGILYLFYDDILKKHIDGYLTNVFRKCVYEVDAKAGCKVYKSDTPGFTGMMNEMKAMYKDHKGDQPFLTLGFTESMDLFFVKLGINPDYYAAFCYKFPKLAAWFNTISANISFSWVVGGAKLIRNNNNNNSSNAKGSNSNVLVIEKCHFRESIGEEGCIETCKIPVEEYFTHRMNAPIKVSPQPREQGLGCKFCYGQCSSKDLEW